MIILRIAHSTWPKVEEYLLHQGSWYSDISHGRVFMIEGRTYKMLRFPDDCQHISYLMIKFNAVDFTKEYIEMEEKYRLDYNY